MGLLSTISSSVKSVTATPTAIIKTLASGAGVKAALSAGMQSEKAYISELKANPLKAVGERVLGQQVIITAAAGAVLGAPKVGAAVLSTAKSAPLAVKLAAPPAALVGAGVLSQSAKAREAAVEVVNPVNYVTFGANIGKAAESPSWENVKKIATDNPYLTGLTAAGAALLAGKVTGTIATISNTRAIKDANELMSNPTQSAPLQGVATGTAKPLDKISTLAGADTPAAVSVSKPKKQGKTSKRRKRKAKVYKCGIQRGNYYGSATKCYNFY